MSSDWSETVFFAVCTPIESKPVTDVRHHPSPRVVEFKAVHGPDMQFLEVSQVSTNFRSSRVNSIILNVFFVQVSNKVEDLLGYKREELENTSWYQYIYPEDIEQARQQHLKFGKCIYLKFSDLLSTWSVIQSILCLQLKKMVLRYRVS